MLGGLGAYASILKVFIGLFPSAIHCMHKPHGLIQHSFFLIRKTHHGVFSKL